MMGVRRTARIFTAKENVYSQSGVTRPPLTFKQREINKCTLSLNVIGGNKAPKRVGPRHLHPNTWFLKAS